MPHFGKRVIGDKAYDEAVRSEKGGANVFGSRVVSSIKGDGPIAQAKRATEHGPRVVAGTKVSDVRGEEGEETVSIDDLRNILAENPTFFDSLYEGELARTDGPRDEALHIFREVERGIKGAGRREILDDIAELLGEKAANAEQRANLNAAHLEQDRRMQERAKENLLLDDAARLESLKKRDDTLKALEKSDRETTQQQLPSLDTGAEVRRIADEEGLDIGGANAESSKATVPTKPDGPVHAETQSPGNRILTPKATSKSTSKSTSKTATAKRK